MKKKTPLPSSFTTISPFTKWLALSLLIVLPILAFYYGIFYEDQTKQGFPNFFCKQWDTVCDPNLVDETGKCAYKTICVDSSKTPTHKTVSDASYPADLRLAINQAKENLSNQLSVDPITLSIVSAETKTWNDGSLGCRKPGTMYTKSFTEGYLVTLSDGNTNYEYHGRKGEEPFLCEHPTAN